jgi:hypothetical protein
MPAKAGTLETIARQIGLALQPLQQRLASNQAIELFAELGLQFPPQVLQPGLVSALNAGAAAAGKFPQTITQLSNAIDNDQAPLILSSGVQLVQEIGSTITAVEQIGTALNNISGSIPGMNAAEVSTFAQNLSSNLLGYLLITYLETAQREVLGVLNLLGAIDYIPNPGVAGDPAHPPFVTRKFQFSRLGDLFKKPNTLLQDLYQWGLPGFDGTALLPRLSTSLNLLGIANRLLPDPPLGLDSSLVSIQAGPGGLSATLNDTIPGGFDFTLPLGGVWSVHIVSTNDLTGGLQATIAPPASVTLHPAAALNANLASDLVAKGPDAAHPIIILGQTNGSRLQTDSFSFGMGVKIAWNAASHTAAAEPSILISVKGGKVVIDMSNADGFLATILSGINVEAGFDLAMSWLPDKGIRIAGGAQLEIDLPLHLSLGPFTLKTLYLVSGVGNNGIPIEISAGLDLALGPIQASVDRVGVTGLITFPNHGNLGPANLEIGFKPPSGVGLAIDAGIVVGGGYLYFDPVKGEYAGVAELAIADVVTVNAIGLITTKLPDGSSGFSLLLVLTTDFPAIQLGFGFTLNAVGGLLGLNRAAHLDVLRDGVRTGAVDHVMFPKNIIANAPRIISDLKTAFPPHEDMVLIGPMAKFGWGTPALMTLSLGIIVEIPPGNIAILGVVRLALPTQDEALILIQVAFIGILDFDEKLLSFDASLYDSRVLFLTLEGDMAVRLKWGDNAAFLLSVGGFHPAFHPPGGLHLPSSMKRLTVSILDYDWAKIKVDCYFAVTSNTVQFGAHLFLFFGVDAANITGRLGMDVLFQFSPFYFIAQISGSLSISVFGFDLLSISLSFSLEGPTPWRAKGTGALHILFFSISVSFDVSWGAKKDTSLPPVQVMPIFLAEVNKQANWKALPPPSTNLLVTLRKVDPSLLILHPFGSLTLSQRALPLDLTLDKVGSQKPEDVKRVDITSVASNGTAIPLSDDKQEFAVAQFQAMSDSDKLSRPSYQELKGGVIIGADDSVKSSRMTRRLINYTMTIIDKEPKQPLPKGQFYPSVSGLFHPFLSGSAAARSVLSYQVRTQLQPFADRLSVGQEGYAVTNTTDNKPLSAASSFSGEAMARDSMNSQLSTNPSLAGGIQVLPNSEVTVP